MIVYYRFNVGQRTTYLTIYYNILHFILCGGNKDYTNIPNSRDAYIYVFRT